jgi:hypothetical protein
VNLAPQADFFGGVVNFVLQAGFFWVLLTLRRRRLYFVNLAPQADFFWGVVNFAPQAAFFC